MDGSCLGDNKSTNTGASIGKSGQLQETTGTNSGRTGKPASTGTNSGRIDVGLAWITICDVTPTDYKNGYKIELSMPYDKINYKYMRITFRRKGKENKEEMYQRIENAEEKKKLDKSEKWVPFVKAKKHIINEEQETRNKPTGYYQVIFEEDKKVRYYKNTKKH